MGIDTVLLTAWQIVDPLKIFENESQKQVKRTETKEVFLSCIAKIKTKDEDVVIVWSYEECRSNRQSIWITMQSIYKGVLMVSRYFEQKHF